MTEGTAEVQREITLLSLYDFLYMCFVLILYLLEKTFKFVNDHKSVLRTDWPFLEIYYQQIYTKYKIRKKGIEREKEGGGCCGQKFCRPNAVMICGG